MQLNIDKVSYTYPGATMPALTAVSATFPQGWTALVGDNGCGKTTLALVASGLIEPDVGTVSPHLFTAFCPQDSAVVPKSLADFAADWSSEAIAIRRVLGISEEWLRDFGHLSGGQKRRVQIACALGLRPDMLVLDEPTNDLDVPTRQQVLSALRAFKGIGILISHDRALMDDLVSRCIMFENGALCARPGGYTKAAEQQKAERLAGAKAHEVARREERRLQAEMHRRSEEAARSTSRLSARKLGKKDSDSREKLGRAKVSGKDAVAGRAAAAMERRVCRAQQRSAASRTVKRYDNSVCLPGRAAASKLVAHMSEGVLRAGVFALHVPELWIGPHDHVGVTGENGAGKTTLLRHLWRSVGGAASADVIAGIPPGISEDAPMPGCPVCVYIPQEVGAELRQNALQRLRSLGSADAGRVLALVAGLNTDPDMLCKGEDISPGEMKKLLIAEQLFQEPSLLILDEPTNHLDIGAIEALERALAEFPGAVLLASHDERLMDAVCDIRWHLEQKNGASWLRIA